ncbi:DMT family transporter [Ancylobacter terrae]|uniref:DMT family transporter n=1 Tax=Ancylobacter sp. sgz301288 TaxID=3342077 RepID=UPI00385F0FEF
MSSPSPELCAGAATSRNDTGRLMGMGAALLAIGIWGFWIVGTRHAVAGVLSPATVGFLRYVVPAALLAPFWWRTGLWPKRPVPFLLCFVGSGAPFFLVVSNGMRFAPAADVGPLLPGTMPLIVAIVSTLVFHERLGRMRVIGFACIALGVVVLGGRGLFESDAGAWRGHLLFLTGAAMWAGYTFGFRRAGMSASEIVALIGLWSAVLLAPVGLPGAIEAVRLGHGGEIVLQLLIQGALSGVVALIAFTWAIERLGTSRAAAFTALVPALAALLAVPLLGEHPDTAAIIGVICSGAGVALASGAFARRR